MKNRQIFFWSALIVVLIAGTGIGLPFLVHKLNKEDPKHYDAIMEYVEEHKTGGSSLPV